MINKRKSIKKFQMLMMLLMVILFKSMSYAADVPKTEVEVGPSGLVLDENVWTNVLTEESDVLLPGDELYTTDSVTQNDFNGVKPGDDIVINLGCIPVDSEGNTIDNITVTLQTFVNTTKTGIIEGFCSELSDLDAGLKDVITDSINSCDDVLSSIYGKYSENTYKTQIKFNSDGTAVLHIPAECPDNYIIAITQMENPETGYTYTLSNLFRLFLALGDGSNSNPPTDTPPGENPPGEEPDTEDDDGHRYYSVGINVTPYAYLTPATSGSIYSSSPEDYYYDVTQGVPTSENLKYTITTDNALYNIATRKLTLKTGVKDITIKVYASYTQYHQSTTYNVSGDKIVKKWKTTEYTDARTVTTDYDYEHTLTLYDVPISSIYPVLSGSLKATNGENILSSGGLTLKGSITPGGQILTYTIGKPNVSDEVSVYIGHYKNLTAATNAVNADSGGGAKGNINAAVVAAKGYTGSTNYAYQGLNVTTTSHNYTKPTVAKASATSDEKLIPATYPNGLYEGSGSVTYTNGAFGVTPNNVNIHTPVVNGAYISSTSDFVNQKINKDLSRTYLMLDEQFTITIPNKGTHNNIKGYGTRNYISMQGVTKAKTTWGKIKDVKLPFDTYLHYTKNNTLYKYFIKANTWLSESGADSVIALTSNSYTFTVPVWVTEKTYDIETRVIAENAIDKSMYSLSENLKNSSITNYVAYKTIPVEIIGKIYDLRVSASNDPGWSAIYSQKNGTNYIAADEFPFGGAGQNKNTAYKYAPKLGYSFVFDFKTKGTKSNNIDVSVQPSGFYFVSRDGRTTQEVDLYYNTTTMKNIKIDLTDKNVNLTVKLRDAYMKVPAQEFTDSTRIYGNKYNYSLGVKIGTFAKMNLPHSLRLCYNNFAEYTNKLYGKGSTENSISNNAGTRDTVIGSVGHWYAGYRLPASTRAIPVGSDINTAIKNNSFLTDGYIVVKFDIKTKYQNASGNWDYLQYMGLEGMNEAIAIYDASLRSSNDSEIGGTH